MKAKFPQSLLFIVCLHLLCLTSIHGQTTTTVSATGNGTFIVPCGVNTITIEAWGAGGAGGGSTSNNYGGGAGGGSGAYVKSTYTVTPGQTINYYVGAGGYGSNNANGTDGQATQITTFSIVAGGGKGGQRNEYGNPGAGGNASGGNIENTNGSYGQYGNSNSGGDGANAPHGGYGGNSEANNDGGNGGNPGAGGGGGEGSGNNSRKGGNGGTGRIVFSYSGASTTYCSPYFAATRPITNVTFAGINSASSSSTASASYENYCDEATVTNGQSYALSISSFTNGGYAYYVSAYFDWDQNGYFEEDEKYNVGVNYNNGTLNTTINVPAAAFNGTTRMRVIQNYGEYVNNACITNNYGQAEDYTVIVTSAPCTTPTAQPTNLYLTNSGATVTGYFNEPTPEADNYLVVYSTNATAPVPANGTTYYSGYTYGDYTIAANNASTTFSVNNLATETVYYFYVFAYNANCSGGPKYLTGTPLTASYTLGISYCLPAVTNPYETYLKQVQFLGTLNDTNNTSTYSTNPSGYQDFTDAPNQSIQAQGEGVNIYLENNVLATVNAWVDWNKDGDFSDSGEHIYTTGTTSIASTTFGFVIPNWVSAGAYTLRIRSDSNSSCNNSETGETEDYGFTVIDNCSAIITSITENEQCGSGSMLLSVTGSSGTTSFKWYDALEGGELIAESSSGNWYTPDISETTVFYVTANNGSCESLVRTAVKATIRPVPPLTTSPENPEICGEDSIIALSAGGEKEEVYLINENFETGSLNTFTYQAITSSTYGSQWSVRESPYIPDVYVWFPAISSGFNGNQFAMSTSDLGGSTNVNNAIVSQTVNTSNFDDLTLSFDIYYSNYAGVSNEDYVAVEISSNNGYSWSLLDKIEDDEGQGSNFTTLTYNMEDYIGITNFKVRFRYVAKWKDGVAIDNINLHGYRPLTTVFNWSGATVDAYLDEACTIPYVEGTNASSTIYIKPTLDQLQSNGYTFTISAALTNGCIAHKDVTVTNHSKVWQGFTDEWENPGNWLPNGVPASTNCVVVKDVPLSDIPEGVDGFAKTFKVKNGGDFTIATGGSLTVTDEVIIEDGGSFHIADKGSLIQLNDAVNIGSVEMERITEISKYDYVYWSSPVANFDVNNVSPDTPGSLVWKWQPTIGNSFGNWINTGEIMEIGKGYSIRAPFDYPVNIDELFFADYTGIPNNGTITKTIERGNYTGNDYDNGNGIFITKYDDNWNLIGNPYPSAISANLFLQANTNIEGAIHLWTHGTNPNSNITDPFYSNYNSNYTVADYVTYNASGASSGPGGFGGYIGAGQGFFVKMLDGAAATETVTFTNNMRSHAYSNSEFYKLSNPNIKNTQNPTPQNGRFWLDLSSPSATTINRILIGYIEGATNNKDRLFDAYADEGVAQNFYSVIDNSENVCINGRALPFDVVDTVPLGLLVPEAGTYTLSIAALDGFFETDAQLTIYVEDTYLNITHNLSASPYAFAVNTSGRYNDRLVIKYTAAPLHSDGITYTNTIKAVSLNSTTIKIKSEQELLKQITVYDMAGKTVVSVSGDSAFEKEFYVKQTHTPLLVKVTTVNNSTQTIKLVH